MDDEWETCTKCLPASTHHHGSQSDYHCAHMTTKRHKYAEEASASSSKVSSYFKENLSKENVQLQKVGLYIIL